jgi:hypothetical protein
MSILTGGFAWALFERVAGGGVFGPAEKLVFVFAAAVVVSAVFYARFRLPFALLLIAGTAFGFAFNVAAGFQTPHWWLSLGIGGVVFAVAMYYDTRDPERTSRLGDCGFWLHVAAAPMIVLGIVGSLPVLANQERGSTAALIVVIFICLGLVALAVDRRALLASGLVYFGVAVGELVAAGTSKVLPHAFGVPTTVTLLLLGGMVFAMSLGWQRLRRVVVGRTPLQRLVPLIPAIR